jgi:hypothetical protein
MARKVLGFDRPLELEWLDAVADRVALGGSTEEVRAFAHRLLDGVVSGTTFNSNRGKTVTVLCHIWSSVPDNCVELRDRAAEALREASKESRLAIHWAMMVATYHFFGDLAEHTGRLLRLQGNANLIQLTRRMQEGWGDRATLRTIVQRLVRSMASWGVLQAAEEKGTFDFAGQPRVVPDLHAELLLEALLIHRGGGSIPVEQALRHPMFFPFTLELQAHTLRAAPRFAVHRQGGSEDVVELVPQD